MVKNIVIFTRDTCASCGTVKAYLRAKGHSYEEVNVDQNPERHAEVIKLANVITIPVTIITKHDDTREVVVGWNPTRLASAVA